MSHPAPHTPDDQLQQLRESMRWQVRRSGSELQRARGAYRNPFARDRARVLHSHAFRHLQGKNLLPGLDDGDILRTGMTRAMETAQLSRGLLRALEGLHARAEAWMPLLPDPNLLEAIALARDIGSPPFGSGGEAALNHVMRDCGGFSSSAQTLRLLARQEPYSEGFGLDPARRTLLGALRHPSPWSQIHATHRPPLPTDRQALRRSDWLPPQTFYDEDQDVVDWLLMPLSSTDIANFSQALRAGHPEGHGLAGLPAFDCSIVNVAASIAQGVHELEDGIVLRRIRREDWEQTWPDAAWAEAVDLGGQAALREALFGESAAARKRAIGTLINAFVVSVEVEARSDIEEPLLRYHATLMPEAVSYLAQLQQLVSLRLWQAPEVQAQLHRGQTLLQDLFAVLASDPERLLGAGPRAAYAAAPDAKARQRIIADHLAGMSDHHALNLAQRLLA